MGHDEPSVARVLGSGRRRYLRPRDDALRRRRLGEQQPEQQRLHERLDLVHQQHGWNHARRVRLGDRRRRPGRLRRQRVPGDPLRHTEDDREPRLHRQRGTNEVVEPPRARARGRENGRPRRRSASRRARDDEHRPDRRRICRFDRNPRRRRLPELGWRRRRWRWRTWRRRGRIWILELLRRGLRHAERDGKLGDHLRRPSHGLQRELHRRRRLSGPESHGRGAERRIFTKRRHLTLRSTQRPPR